LQKRFLQHFIIIAGENPILEIKGENTPKYDSKADACIISVQPSKGKWYLYSVYKKKHSY